MQPRHVLLLVIDLASVFLFSGIIFGWAPLNAILIDEDFYRSLCKPGDPKPCEAQANALNRAFTIASTAVSMVAIPAGYIVDRFGPFVGTFIAGVLEVGGLVGIAVCEDVYRAYHFDLFLVCAVVIAIGGSLTMFSAYSMPFLFPKRATLVIELTSCLFDASCIMFSFFKLARDSLGFTFKLTWWAYTCLAAGVYAILVFAWFLNSVELQNSRSSTKQARETMMSRMSQTQEERPDTGEPKPISERPLAKQLLTIEFFGVCIYAAIQVARSNLYLGSVDLTNRQWATKAGWKGQLTWVTSAVGLIVPFGFVVVPLIELSIHRLGLIGTFHITSIVGIGYNLLQMLPSEGAQLAGAFVFAAFRAFLFSIISAWNAATFGPITMGRVMGLCFLASALVNLLQAPLVSYSLSLDPPTGDFMPVLIGSVIASLPPALFWLVVALVQRSRRRFHALLAASLLEGQPDRQPASGHEADHHDPVWKHHATAVGASPDSWSATLAFIIEERESSANKPSEEDGPAPLIAADAPPAADGGGAN